MVVAQQELNWRRVAPQDYRATLPNGTEARVSGWFVDDSTNGDGGISQWQWIAEIGGSPIEGCTFPRMYNAKAAVNRWVAEHAVEPCPERTAHIRKLINPNRVRGNGFYKVTLSAAENGSQTLCGAKSTTIDLGYGDFARRRPGFDWQRHIASLPPEDAMSGAIVCEGCLREAAELRARRAKKN